jgi:predicted DCC family thiol-disulfide oxidoreductase YuxK
VEVPMTESDRAKITGHPVLLYDGVCALCNGVVQFVLKRDKAGLFRFAALQSDVSRELLGVDQATPDGVALGVVLVIGALTAEQCVYRRSDAVAETLKLLGHRVLGRMLATMPGFVRETGYDVVARPRYKLFGRYEVCPLPAPDVRGRFVGVEDSRE